ncbi:hypothetical protein [Paracoccus aminovorans]
MRRRISGEVFNPGIRRSRLTLKPSGSEVQILQSVFLRHEAVKGLEPGGEFIGRHEIGKAFAQLDMAVVVEAFDSGILDGAGSCARPGRSMEDDRPVTTPLAPVSSATAALTAARFSASATRPFCIHLGNCRVMIGKAYCRQPCVQRFGHGPRKILKDGAVEGIVRRSSRGADCRIPSQLSACAAAWPRAGRTRSDPERWRKRSH